MRVLRGGLSWTSPLFRIAAGGVLAISGYLKAVRPAAEFAATLESYWLFPPFLIFPMAHVVPWVELIVGLFLVVGFFTRGSAFVAAGLYATFVAVLAQSIFRKLPMPDCGCFGQVGPHLQPIQALSLDLGLMVICLLVLFDREKRISADRWIDQS
jgi:uncharacterized membrane protein YphA (DoxX/SURF4 family)